MRKEEVQNLYNRYYGWFFSTAWKKTELNPKYHSKAEKIVTPLFKYFSNLTQEDLTGFTALLIREIEENFINTSMTPKSFFAYRSSKWKNSFEMANRFVKVLECFKLGIDQGSTKKNIEFEDQTGLFEVKEVVFRGERKEIAIKKSEAFDVFIEMFDIINAIHYSNWEEPVSPELIELKNKLAYVLSSNYDSYVGARRKWHTLKDPNSAMTAEKYRYAYKTHIFLAEFSLKSSKAKYPSWHKRYIGQVFEAAGIEPYLGYTDDKKIANWIDRGASSKLEAAAGIKQQAKTRTKKASK